MKKLIEIIESTFRGIHIEKDDEYPYIDTEQTPKNILNQRWFSIDSFPKKMDQISLHSILDTFWDLDEDKTRYLIQENKFIRTILLITSYSKQIIISTNYIENEQKNYIENPLTQLEKESLKTVQSEVFTLEEIQYDYQTLNALIKLSLREKIHTEIYMIDLQIILEINGLYTNVYLGEQGDIELIKYISNTEGLYIRERHIDL